jgi:predicted amino acid-binding ACT domain protein
VTLTQLRVELPDHPGALAAITRVLARLRMNVVEVAIHEVDGPRAVDEIVVEAADPVGSEELRASLASAGADLLSISPCDARTDLVIAAAAWVSESLPSPHRRGTLVAAVHALTGINPVYVVPAAAAEDTEIGLTAIRRGRPVVKRLEELPPFLVGDGVRGGARWVLAAPDGPDPTTVVFASRPFSVRFTATELRRLTAVLDCRRRMIEALTPVA